MPPLDRELCEAEELIDFIIRGSLLLVKCPETYPHDAHIMVWSANAREQIAEYLKRIKNV